jgi:hypothetical protein
MAAGKKSFVLYSDLIHTIEKMPSEKAGDLFKHILRYVNDQNPITNDLIIELTFEPIKQQLKRDLEKWETEIKPKRSESGKLGGIKSGEARRNKMKQNEANASITKQTEANEAVNVNVNVNDSIYSFSDFWNDYAKKVDTKKCEDKYSKISEDDRAKIKVHIPKYIASTPDIKFRKNPLTYLNGKCWLDEVKEPEREETEREYNLRLWKERRNL